MHSSVGMARNLNWKLKAGTRLKADVPHCFSQVGQQSSLLSKTIRLHLTTLSPVFSDPENRWEFTFFSYITQKYIEYIWHFKLNRYLCTRKTEVSRCHSSVGRAKDWKSLCPRFDSWWHHFLRKKNDVNPWISKKFGDFSFPKIGKISGIGANYTSLFKGLFLKARNVPQWGVYFILLQHVA